MAKTIINVLDKKYLLALLWKTKR